MLTEPLENEYMQKFNTQNKAYNEWSI